MTTESGQPWVPTTDAEKAVKEAFDKLNDSLDKGLIKTDADAPARFILNSKGYFDLKCYVETGKTFPATNNEFETRISKDAFNRLTDADPDIYQTTQKTLVSIGSSCSAFAKDYLASLVTVAQEAIYYTDNAILWLSDMDNLNLRAQLEILLNSKYTSKATEDDAYRTALDLATVALSVLKSDALDKKQATQKVLEGLLNTATLSNQHNLNLLIQQYETGPVKSKTDKIQDPFLKYLNADLADAKAKLTQLIADKDSKGETWKDNVQQAWYMSLIPCIGMTYTSEAISLGDEYIALLDQVNKAQADNKEESALVEFVSKTVEQGHDIEQKMKDAITAMQELHDLFSAQAQCYDEIAITLLGMSAGINSLHTLASRKVAIETTLRIAIGKLQDLKKVAQEFVNDAVRSIDLMKKE